MSKKPQKLDPRVIRTRQLLRDALVTLIKEKGYDRIKIKEITDYATLNKATFYLHYRDKEDLLIRSSYDLLEELDDEIGLPKVKVQEMSPKLLLELVTTVFKHFEKHADYYRIIINKIGTPPVMAAIQNPIEAIVKRWLTQLQGEGLKPVVEVDMITRFVSNGFIGVLQKWLTQESPPSAEHIAKQFLNLIILGIYQSIGLTPPDVPNPSLS